MDNHGNNKKDDADDAFVPPKANSILMTVVRLIGLFYSDVVSHTLDSPERFKDGDVGRYKKAYGRTLLNH